MRLFRESRTNGVELNSIVVPWGPAIHHHSQPSRAALRRACEWGDPSVSDWGRWKAEEHQHVEDRWKKGSQEAHLPQERCALPTKHTSWYIRGAEFMNASIQERADETHHYTFHNWEDECDKIFIRYQLWESNSKDERGEQWVKVLV